MSLKTKSGRIVQVPTAEEDAAINAGIAADPDARELGDEWFAQAKPASEFYPAETYAALVAMKRPPGRPKADETKIFTAIRLDADLLAAFKSTGKGWQTRVNAALRQYIAEHPITR
ncbi:MAG: BrnA antitoxin family protein [Pseudomonadota bacterium]|nr:BrnA antitoxin family protein [Pseudomonadota bacterium]MDP1906262.1 BrnA antitoxin family protein [Pseudomonadota bacterium]MDP2353808.1 BrnA antitoxin family protein [Pseudomonadota bacterium]